MANFTIRKVDDGVAAKIDSMAKRKGLSREEYVRKLLTTSALTEDIADVELRYTVLVDRIMERLEHQNQVLERNNELLELVAEKL